MKVEAVGAEYEEYTLNVGVYNEAKKADIPHTVVFKKNIAEVPDAVGQMLISSFPYIFPEGKVMIPENKPKVHVFDETKYEQLHDKIAKLNVIIKSKDQEISELKGEVKEWKRQHEDLQTKFAILGKKGDEPAPAPVETETSFNTEDDYRKELEQKSIDELKSIATELKVPDDVVKKKTAKKSWVDAIIETTFKV